MAEQTTRQGKRTEWKKVNRDDAEDLPRIPLVPFVPVTTRYRIKSNEQAKVLPTEKREKNSSGNRGPRR